MYFAAIIAILMQIIYIIHRIIMIYFSINSQFIYISVHACERSVDITGSEKKSKGVEFTRKCLHLFIKVC